jgi:diacylglycerol kinase (ATP)
MEMPETASGSREVRGGIVIFNPAAGRGHAAVRRLAVQERLGDAWEWRATERPGHAEELALAAAREGAPIVAAFGGDGTVGDVARGIYGAQTGDEASASALGILPSGTGNDVARNLGLPIDPESACETLQRGRVRRIDLGMINGRPFINNAGTGFDAAVMGVMNTSIRFVRGKPAFILAILKLLPSFGAFSLTLSRDGGPAETLPAMMVSVLNGPVYAAGMKACPGASVDDGELDVLVIREMPKAKLLALFPKVIAGEHAQHPAVWLFRAKQLSLSCDPSHPLTLDGEIIPSAPARIHVLPGALNVIAP